LKRRGNARIAAKLRWIADYHDFFVTQVVWKPEWLIGSEQSHHFASFNLDWMRAPMGHLPITELVLGNFEHICAQADVAESASSVDGSDTVDPGQTLGTILRSIERQCQLLDANEKGEGPSVSDPAVSSLVSACRGILESASMEVSRVDGLRQEDAIDALWALDKGLRIVRVDHRADAVVQLALAAFREVCSERS
jgi:hypothetical protein